MTPSLVSEYDALRNGAGLLARPRGIIEVSGTEAAVFLHNLCTNDIKSLPPGKGCEAFWCTATAKVIAHGSIWRGADDGKKQWFFLDLPPALADKVLAHLDRYLISEDVTLSDRSADFSPFHLAGPHAPSVLAAAGLLPSEIASLTQIEIVGITLRHFDALGVPGFDLLCPGVDHAAIRQRLLDAGATEVSETDAEVIRVETGTPTYGADIDDTTFAPEVNRTARAISYNKGCYLGQEPIVMARDRGVIQRLFVGLTFPTTPLPTGTLLHRDGKEVGRITSSLVSPRHGPIGLGYVRRGSQAPGTALEADSPSGKTPVVVAALPLS